MYRDYTFEYRNAENDYQTTQFDNPFNTHPVRPLATLREKISKEHGAGLQENNFVKLKLNGWKYVANKVAEFSFALPKPTDHLGCLV